MIHRVVLVLLLPLVCTTLMRAHTAKTFLMHRSESVNALMNYTWFKRLIEQNTEGFCSSLQATYFYQDSTAQRDAARYFLMNNKSTISLPLRGNTDLINNLVDDTARSTVIHDVDFGYLVHTSVSSDQAQSFNNSGGAATLSLAPRRTLYGVNLAYHQKLWSTGWILDITLPIVDIKHDTKLNVVGKQVATTHFINNGQNGVSVTINAKQNLDQALRGIALSPVNNVNVTTLPHTNAKFGRQRSVGVADLDVRFAYQFFSTPTCHFSLGAGITAPMGNRPTGEFVFEAIRGNGRHWGAGGDVALDMRVWGDYGHNIVFNAMAHYCYLFSTKQCRTLGLLGRPFGQHYLLGSINHDRNVLITMFTPAANVLTRDVDVTGCSQCDTVFGFTYNNHALTFNLGYNFYYRDAEVVRQRTSFPDDTWAVAARGAYVGYAFGDSWDLTVFDGGTQDAAIVNDSTIDVKAAATPMQVLHSVFASLDYLFGRDSKNPWMLGVGGKYEMPSCNSVLEQWGVWAKVGVGF